MTILAIVGATATGKTALGIALARELNGEIVNADALQVYRGLDIGTAKPSAAERGEVPHHLIDILDPDQPFSAGDFSRLGRQAIVEIQARGRLPIIVGGSGLYLRALFDGLSPLPPRDPLIRARLAARLLEIGLPALHSELAEVDPEAAVRLPKGDTQRILRALEVYQASGRNLTSWWQLAPTLPPLSRVQVGLTVSRSILYHRIAVRVQQMVERGWVGEVSELISRGVAPTAAAFQAIGYRQIVDVLMHRSTLEDAQLDIVRSTCHYAKRQETWFRREREVFWIQGPRAEVAIPFVLQELKSRGAFAQ
jgi:tRNA dimethylallyltransferase